MKVLGLGNPTRGDDAAGARVVRLLQGLGIEARVLQREPLELLEVWRPEDDVVVIDTVLSGAPCGTIQTWNRASLALPGPASASTHSLGLAETIELARALGGSQSASLSSASRGANSRWERGCRRKSSVLPQTSPGRSRFGLNAQPDVCGTFCYLCLQNVQGKEWLLR